MKDLWVHRYALRGRRDFNPRTTRREFPGALIRSGEGFGCIHPWPEFGDDPLEAHLEALKEGAPTLLGRIALRCVLIDGEARKNNKNLFNKFVKIIRSHFLWRAEQGVSEQAEELVAGGFRATKLKALRDTRAFSELLDEVDSVLPPYVKFRPDFNATLTEAEFLAWAQGLSDSVRSRIQLIEDPVPYDPEDWARLQDETGLSFAIDQWLPQARGGYRFGIVKPARDGEVDLDTAALSEVPLVFTSAMDHPIGQLYAAHEATVFAERQPARSMDGGLLTHNWFEGDPFCEALQVEGGHLVPPDGTGLGFDDLLGGLKWERL